MKWSSRIRMAWRVLFGKAGGNPHAPRPYIYIEGNSEDVRKAVEEWAIEAYKRLDGR